MAGTTDHHQHDDITLVRRAIDGDADAYGVLYTRHLDAIYRYIYFRVGDEAQAEDMTEEVFVRAWEALPKYKVGKHPFTSWLYRIAHNLVIDHRRKRGPLMVEADHLAGREDGAATPEEMVAQEQDMAALAWAIQQLEDEEQQVITLRFIEGLSHREVGRIIGKSEGASRVIQHRALAALYELLRGQGNPDG